jgi:hypothetical protein
MGRNILRGMTSTEAVLWTKMEASLRYVTETKERCLCMQCYRHG